MTSLISVSSFILAAIVLTVAATLWRAAHREAQWEARYPATGQFVELGDFRVHYEQIGTGPDVVLIHGASGNTRDMMITLAPLLADRYRVTVFDRPGLGYSTTISDTSPAGQAQILRDAAKALGVDRPVVLGHSYGGAVAMAWAVNHPDDIAALVDVSGAIYPWDGGVDWLYDLIGTRLGYHLGPAMLAAWAPESYMRKATASVFVPQQPLDGYYDLVGAPLVVRRSSMRANAMQVFDLNDHLIAQSPDYTALTLPIEIVHGHSDDIVYLSVHSVQLAETLPQANLTVLRGEGHMPHHTAPAQIVAAVDRAARSAGLN